MNLISSQPNFDWHEPGIWIAVHPEDGPDTQFVGTTAHACRVELRRHGVKHYTASGWTFIKLVQETEPVLHLRDQVTSNETRWRYPANGEPAPSGDVLLLTVGRITVIGTWTNDGRFIAWAPKIQRDKELEARLEL